MRREGFVYQGVMSRVGRSHDSDTTTLHFGRAWAQRILAVASKEVVVEWVSFSWCY